AHGPLARTSHAMFYDSARHTAVLFGGESGATIFGDTWQWNGKSWTQACTASACIASAPAARSGHAMAFDRVNGVAVLFGGQGTSAPFADTWLWNGATWSKACASGCAAIPPARFGHAMAYDSARKR